MARIWDERIRCLGAGEKATLVSSFRAGELVDLRQMQRRLERLLFRPWGGRMCLFGVLGAGFSSLLPRYCRPTRLGKASNC